jgi:hypothetical protein
MKPSLNKQALIFILIVSMIARNAYSQTSFVWGNQYGSDKDEYSLNHVTDNNGNIYISGKTTGDIDCKNFGGNDGFIIKTDSLGNRIWARQFGTSGEEDVQWSAIDNSGCVYITGSTTGALHGKNFGMEDIFIVKYDPDGEMEWMEQFGTDSLDLAKGICTDSKGSVYLTGMTKGKLGQDSYGKTDCFIMKLDSKGNQKFISQFGTDGDDGCYSIISDGGSDIYVCGTTWGDIGAKNNGLVDGFTGQFNNDGELIKYTHFGTDGFDIPLIILIDNEKNIYVGGSTSGSLGCEQIGEGDAFIIKISEKGDILWKTQFGTDKNDGVRGMDLNSYMSDNLLVSGIINLPPGQAFIRMYNKDGGMLWERNFIALGNNGGTSGKDITFDNRGNFIHLGLTGANLFGALTGEHDVYLVKFKLDKKYMNH